jgi:hypothetical protein
MTLCKPWLFLFFPQVFGCIHHSRERSMFAYDKLFILLSYFNNMRPPIHNTQPTRPSLRVTRQKDVLVDCQCKTLREVKWDFTLWRNVNT